MAERPGPPATPLAAGLRSIPTALVLPSRRESPLYFTDIPARWRFPLMRLIVARVRPDSFIHAQLHGERPTLCIIRTVIVSIVREFCQRVGKSQRGGEYDVTLLVHDDKACCPSPT